MWGGTETYLAVRDPETYGKKELLSRWAWPQVWNSWTYPGFEGHPVQIDVYSPGDRWSCSSVESPWARNP